MSGKATVEKLPRDSVQSLDQMVEGLGTKQAVALAVIMTGGTVASAAKTAEVARSTIYEWMSSGSPFQAALDRWTKDLVRTARNRLLILTDSATVVVQDSLRRGDVRTGLRLLERLGVLAAPPTGKTEAEVRRRANQIKVKREARRLRREREVEGFIGEWKIPEISDADLGPGESVKGWKSAKGLKGVRHESSDA